MRTSRICACTALIALALAVSIRGADQAGQEEAVTVKGTVTVNGQPLASGRIFFHFDDDQFVGVIRFDSREAAMRNSERPEQGEWAKRMTALIDGSVEYHDCDDVTLMFDGGSDDAGYVHYYSVDGDALAELREYFESFWEDALAAFKEAAEKGEQDESADE